MTHAPTTGQLALPGQVAAPDGPVDLVGMFVMHHGFRRDLQLFAAAVPRIAVSDQPRWRRLSRRWALFESVLHKHHRGEDAGLWPMLRARAGADASLALDAIEREHQQIDPLLTACGAGLRTLRNAGSHTDREALHSNVIALRDELGHHLAHEESEALPLVQRHLSQDDWDMLDRRYFAKEYRLAEVPRSLAWVMLGLPADAAQRTAARQPGMLTAGRFLARRLAAADRRAFPDDAR